MAKLIKLDFPTAFGQPLVVDIDTVNTSGDGLLTAEASSKKGDSFNVVVVETEPKRYTITFNPPDPDTYILALKWGDEVIVGSPFDFFLGPPNPKAVVISDPPSGTMKAGEKIKIGFNISKAGCGEFTTACKAEDIANIPVTVTRHGFNCDIEFTPPHEDIYFVEVKWSGKNIRGSPFKLDMVPIIPANVVLSNFTVPSEPEGCIELDICTDRAGNAELKGICKGAEVGNMPVTINKVSPGNYHLSALTSPVPDTYTLSISFSNQRVPGSPLLANLLPTDASKVKVQEPQDPKLAQNVCFGVDATRAGKGELTASCQGISCGDVRVDVKQEQTGQCSVTLCPEQADIYTVAIQWDGKNVPNSPFELDLIPLGPDRVRHLQTTVPDNRNEPVALSFETSKAGTGKLHAEVSGAVSGSLSSSVELLPGLEHEYQVLFVPENGDIYSVNVCWNDFPVPGSPYNVTIIQPEKIVVSEPELIELGKTVELKVDASKTGPGDITASCTGQTCREMEVDIVEDFVGPAKSYVLSINPSIYDVYSVSVFFSGVEIIGSPIMVHVEEPEIPVVLLPDASKCFVFGLDSIPTVLTPSQKIAFGVNTADAGEGSLSVSVDGPSSHLVEPQIVVQSAEEDASVYNIEYVPTGSGAHHVNLQWAGEPITGSPVILNVGDVKDIPTYPMNNPYLIQFIADCNPREVSAYGVHEMTGKRYDLSITRELNGRAKLTFHAKLPGVHSLHLFVSGEELPGSPYKVDFIESDSQACSIKELPDKAYLGEETSFKIDARKAGIGDLHVHAQVPRGGKGTKFGHKYHKNGYYSINFTPKVPGVHHFDISWGGTVILDSPVEIVAEKRDPNLQVAQESASKVHILKEDLYIFNVVLPLSLPANFSIDTAGAGKGKLTLTATGPSKAQLLVTDRKSGVYTAEFQPNVSGKYHLSIFLNNIHIHGSPFLLNYTGDKSHVISGLDFETVRFVIDVPYKFHLHHSSSEEGKLELACTPTTAATMKCNQLSHAPNSYLCEIVPKEAGNQEISIKYNDKHVFNSPHIVQFEQSANGDDPEDIPLDVVVDVNTEQVGIIPDTGQPPSCTVAEEVRVHGPGLSECLVGQEGNFTVETSRAGDGKLEIDMSGPKGAFQIKMRRHPENNHTILVRYDPVVVGTYTIDVLWSGDRVPGSPFTVNVLEQSVATEILDM